jgi:hypothetical protein
MHSNKIRCMKKLFSIFFMLIFFQLVYAQDRKKDVKPPSKTQKTKTNTSTGIGVSIDLASIFRSLKRNKNCNQIKMVFPKDGSKFKSNRENPLLFRWKSSKPKLVVSYKVQLVQINEKEKTTLFQGETDKTQFPWPEEVAWVTSKSEKVTYQWYVMAILKIGTKCKNVIESTKFTVTTDIPIVTEDHQKKDRTIKNIEVVLDKNPSKEIKNDNDKQRKLISTSPKNNSAFKNLDELNSFNWKLIGNKIESPHYIIEVVRIGKNRQPERTYIAKTNQSNIKAIAVFKDLQLNDGQYSWKVTETTTAISSNHSYFTMSQCEIDFTISNENIECLGYEGADRKFKVCFDANYSSTSGDLTFTTPNGLSVFDQTYATLTYTLISPNPTLITQVGATTSTVSYCFEVIVPSSVTSIGFGLQGDDLDPSPIVCQPGVSNIFNDLPTCICNDCDNIELTFDNFNISLNGSTGNQFNFNGDINVNVPIYGLEFQIQSYTYSATPSACTEGVSSIEESGMFLIPGTTINGSTSLQLFNETISGSSNSNNNATKDIKYMSNTPLTGSIPVNLTIGLPGPISGLDPSCCVINYTVCIKVKIFYEDGNCKTCVFKHCFQFDNQ